MIYAAFLHIVDHDINAEQRLPHLAYINRLHLEGKIIKAGPFIDGFGGLVLYKTESLEEARRLAEQDPVVPTGACTLEMREWQPFQFPI
jgi:uncharacterized protein YciI